MKAKKNVLYFFYGSKRIPIEKKKKRKDFTYIEIVFKSNKYTSLKVEADLKKEIKSEHITVLEKQ